MKLYCYDSEGSGRGHGNVYDDFVEDYRYSDTVPALHYPEEYTGQAVFRLCCSQHSHVVDGVETISDYRRKLITASWAEFFKTEKALPIKEMQVCTRMPQSVFDALCGHPSIESLRIKQLTGKDIGQISRLTGLKKLFIESAPSLSDLRPLAALEELEVLILGDTKKVADYSPLGELKKLKVFSLCSYRTYDNLIPLEDDSFMFGMELLEYVDMCDARIKTQRYLTPENVKGLKYALFYM